MPNPPRTVFQPECPRGGPNGGGNRESPVRLGPSQSHSPHGRVHPTRLPPHGVEVRKGGSYPKARETGLRQSPSTQSYLPPGLTRKTAGTDRSAPSRQP